MPCPNLLVVDANILFSFFKKNSIRRHLVEDLLNLGCKLISPYFLLEELRLKKNKIIQFSEISMGEFEFAFSTITDEIILVSEDKYNSFLFGASKISPHTKDIPYFALALALNCPIWSDEKAFKEQSKVKIFSTIELINLFK